MMSGSLVTSYSCISISFSLGLVAKPLNQQNVINIFQLFTSEFVHDTKLVAERASLWVSGSSFFFCFSDGASLRTKNDLPRIIAAWRYSLALSSVKKKIFFLCVCVCGGGDSSTFCTSGSTIPTAAFACSCTLLRTDGCVDLTRCIHASLSLVLSDATICLFFFLFL